MNAITYISITAQRVVSKDADKNEVEYALPYKPLTSKYRNIIDAPVRVFCQGRFQEGLISGVSEDAQKRLLTIRVRSLS